MSSFPSFCEEILAILNFKAYLDLGLGLIPSRQTASGRAGQNN